MNRITLVFLGCCIVSPLAFGQSSGDSAAGKKLAEEWQCTLCHGPDGNGNKVIANAQMAEVPGGFRGYPPNLGLISSRACSDYKSGKRSNDNMQVMAKQLSDNGIRDLAAWYGSQKPRAPKPPTISTRRD